MQVQSSFNEKDKGRLYLVPTPIGNLEDITLRAKRILTEADYIAAEDTRTSGILLEKIGVHNKMISFHKYNSKERAPELIKLLKEGKTIAEILSRHPDKLSQIESILVEPQSDVPLCVSALNSFGFQNVDGSYIFEKRYYPILFYVRGKEELNEVECQFGLAPLQKKDPILIEFLNIEKRRIESLNQQGKKRNLSYYKLVLEALAYDESE